MGVIDKACNTIEERGLASAETPVLLMVSGGSDSTALAYIAYELRSRGVIGPVAMLHVNHKLRGADSDGDAEFTSLLAGALNIPLFSCDIDVAALVKYEKGNMEAIARRERYAAAKEALVSMCRHEGYPVSDGRIFTAHTADDRIENFYMRSIVGTGPGGFRSMLYLNGQVARPLLDASREELRDYIRELAGKAAAENEVRASAIAPYENEPATVSSASESATATPVRVISDEAGALWREDATNEHTDRFRAFVRAQIVPLAKERNPQLVETLSRTMNLIADEDDMLDNRANEIEIRCVKWLDEEASTVGDYSGGCLITPSFANEATPLKRRVLMNVLGEILGGEARVETASIEAVLASYCEDRKEAGEPLDDDDLSGGSSGKWVIASGYVSNIQGNLAVSANKKGVRIEPMAAFRARRNRSS